MSQTGRRVAEMHVALASNNELPDFVPEPIKSEDGQRWIDDVMARATRVFDTLAQRRDSRRRRIVRWSTNYWRSARHCRSD